jgi:cytochrome c553
MSLHPARIRPAVFAAALAVVATAVGLARADEPPAEPRRPASAERGYRHLLDTPFIPAAFDQEVFDNLWRVWPEEASQTAQRATPAERRRMAFERYGLTPRPGEDTDAPLQFVVDEAGGWHMSCLACHGGQVGGKTIPGLPNAHFAFQTLVDDVRATKRRLGRPADFRDLAARLIPFGRTVGTTNAVVFSIALLQFRDVHMNVRPSLRVPRFPHHDLDAPPWWHYKRRTHIYIDGFGKHNHRSLMPFVLVPENGRERVLSFEDAFRDIERYLESLEPPPYPHEIDEKLARRGETVFRANCASCHGTYGEGGSYPNRLVPIAQVGTDRVRLDALTPRERTIYSKSWLTEYDPEGVRTDPGGYVAPPLDGLWASAPYFHNGAVPTLWHVLHPDARPAAWRRDPNGYDPERVGLRIDVADEVPATEDPHERRRWFDTTLRGKSAAGHTFPARLSTDQRRSLLEYLKTL